MKKNKKLYLTIGFILISIPLLCAAPLIKSSQNNKNEAAGYTKDVSELTRIVDVINLIENRLKSIKKQQKDKCPNKCLPNIHEILEIKIEIEIDPKKAFLHHQRLSK